MSERPVLMQLERDGEIATIVLDNPKKLNAWSWESARQVSAIADEIRFDDSIRVVILRAEGQVDPPPESVLDACELSVHFSKQKNAGHADVHVVPIKQVSKPRGAKKGLVYVTGGRSIRLRREETRLRRVLEARMDP